VDNLTGLADRAEAVAWVNERSERADLLGEPFSIVLVNVDDMRAINDSYGHSAGHFVLRRLGELMRDAAGANDLAAPRWRRP
jgi:diguanylate cyclase (GGDEF)-like protein